MMHIGYNTNSLADHPLADALALVADHGYTAVALTVGYPHVRPFDSDLGAQLGALRAMLDKHGLQLAIETGARYLLDPHNKHKPSLVDIAAQPRIEFMRRAIDIAADLGATCVSLWSGYAVRHTDPQTTRDLLIGRLAELVDYADRNSVTLGFEPEPGMYVETVAQARDLCHALGDPVALRITLDVGHCVMTEPSGAAPTIVELGEKLVNVHLDDMTPHKHEHLEFGHGNVDLGAVLDALSSSGFTGIASVELPRHSNDAPNVMRRSMSAIKMARLKPAARSWIAGAAAEISRNPDKVLEMFPGAERGVAGAGDEAALVARQHLLTALLADTPDATAGPLMQKLYRWGDTDERLAVLRGLSAAAPDDRLGAVTTAAGVELAADALRCNDPRLVGAALGGFGSRFLDQHTWRHGVMKLIFMGVPLRVVHGLRTRVDAELGRMATDYIAERQAAGRSVPSDAETLKQLTAIRMEVAE